MASLCFLHVLLKKTLFDQLYLSNKLCGVFPVNRRDRLADTVITIVICITAVINLMPQITKTTVMGKFPKTVLAVNRYVRFPITRCSLLYRLYCTSATNHHDFVYGMRRNQSTVYIFFFRKTANNRFTETLFTWVIVPSLLVKQYERTCGDPSQKIGPRFPPFKATQVHEN